MGEKIFNIIICVFLLISVYCVLDIGKDISLIQQEYEIAEYVVYTDAGDTLKLTITTPPEPEIRTYQKSSGEAVFTWYRRGARFSSPIIVNNEKLGGLSGYGAVRKVRILKTVKYSE